jgi:hypothetical protein
MSITHAWKIRKLIQKNDGSGLVIQVFYKVYSSDGEYDYVSAGNVELITENLLNFVPYADLTEELVIGWVKDKLGPNLGNHEQINSEWINAAKNPAIPTTKVERLPWEPDPTPVFEPTPEPTP